MTNENSVFIKHILYGIFNCFISSPVWDISREIVNINVIPSYISYYNFISSHRKCWSSKKFCMISRKKKKKVKETAPQTPTGKRIGKRCSRCQSKDSPAACHEDHGDSCCAPTALGEPHWGRYLPCRPWKTPCQNRWIGPKGSCSPQRVHTGAKSWQGL